LGHSGQFGLQRCNFSGERRELRFEFLLRSGVCGECSEHADPDSQRRAREQWNSDESRLHG
jgi:hypothetical protein